MNVNVFEYYFIGFFLKLEQHYNIHRQCYATNYFDFKVSTKNERFFPPEEQHWFAHKKFQSNTFNNWLNEWGYKRELWKSISFYFVFNFKVHPHVSIPIHSINVLKSTMSTCMAFTLYFRHLADDHASNCFMCWLLSTENKLTNSLNRSTGEIYSCLWAWYNVCAVA